MLPYEMLQYFVYWYLSILMVSGKKSIWHLLYVYSPVFVECKKKKKFKYTQMKVLTNDLDEKNLIELIRSAWNIFSKTLLNNACKNIYF